jgi:hypothetical protein
MAISRTTHKRHELVRHLEAAVTKQRSICAHCGAEADVPGWLHLCAECSESPVAQVVERHLGHCAECGEIWPCSDSERRDVDPRWRARHYRKFRRPMGVER